MKFDHHIMGGTLTSTLAGEYSFTIALACSLFFLGTLAMALESAAAVVAARACSSRHPHEPSRRRRVRLVGRVRDLAVIPPTEQHRARGRDRRGRRGADGRVDVPLAATLKYTTDMRYEPVAPVHRSLAARTARYRAPDVLRLVVPVGACGSSSSSCIVAIGAGIVYRRRSTLIVARSTFLAGTVFCGWELLRDILGKAPAWNLRLLPFWYLMLYLLAALGAAEIVRWIGSSSRGSRAVVGRCGPRRRAAAADSRRRARTRSSTTGPVARSRAVRREPSPRDPPRRDRLVAAAHHGRRSWFNQTQGLPRLLGRVELHRVRERAHRVEPQLKAEAEAVPEYRAFIDRWTRCRRVACCGRAASSTSAAYGTPLALMLLPYWTDGRIRLDGGPVLRVVGDDAVRFMAVAPRSRRTPSNPVRGLTTARSTDFAAGVRYLQLLGGRYYAGALAGGEGTAANEPGAALSRHRPRPRPRRPQGWRIYEVATRPSSRRLRYEPVVVRDLHADDNRQCLAKPEPAPERRVAELERVGVPRRAVVQRPRRARPAAHRRRARRAGSGRRCSMPAKWRKSRFPT